MEAAVEFRRVTVRHPRSFGPVFKHLTLRIEQGLTTVVGSHISGKSTLLSTAAGVIRPRHGSVRVLGLPLRRRRREVMRRIGYLPHVFVYLPRVTIAEAVAYSAWLKSVPSRYLDGAVSRTLEATGLENWRGTVLEHAPDWVRRRAGLAQALVHTPELLILDEPTAGLPAEQRAAFNALIPQLAQERSIIVSTRLPEEVHEAGRVLLVHGGHVRYNGHAEGFVPELYRRWVHQDAAPDAELVAESGVEPAAEPEAAPDSGEGV